jgi:hypothetical protein
VAKGSKKPKTKTQNTNASCWFRVRRCAGSGPSAHCYLTTFYLLLHLLTFALPWLAKLVLLLLICCTNVHRIDATVFVARAILGIIRSKQGQGWAWLASLFLPRASFAPCDP